MSVLERLRAIHGHTILFYIERSMDSEIVVYKAQRQGNNLVNAKVTCFWSNLKNLEAVDEVSEKAQDIFFGSNVKKIDNQYKMVVTAYPNKVISLHLKKSGKVLAKAIIKGKEAKLEKLYIKIEQPSTLSLPQATAMVIYGIHKKGERVREKLEVTEDIRRKFDISSFLPGVGSFF